MSGIYIEVTSGLTMVQPLNIHAELKNDGWVLLGEPDLQSTIDKYQSLVHWNVTGANVPPLDPVTRELIDIPKLEMIPCSCQE
jgi:hypothetical protein